MQINWREYKPHVINQFPAMSDEEFNDLKESLTNDGYDESMPIVLYKGDGDLLPGIIDGANRHRACLETGVIPMFKTFYGSYEDAMSYILRTNTRRNLKAGQKAAIVLDMDGVVSKLVEEAAKRVGMNQHSGLATSGHTSPTANKLAGMAGVGKETVKQAMKVKQHDPQLYEAIKSGSISAKSAYNQIQDRIVDGDEALRQQRLAKSLLKNAIQSAIEESKDELYNEALRLVIESDGTPVSLKLKIELCK